MHILEKFIYTIVLVILIYLLLERIDNWLRSYTQLPRAIQLPTTLYDKFILDGKLQYKQVAPNITVFDSSNYDRYVRAVYRDGNIIKI